MTKHEKAQHKAKKCRVCQAKFITSQPFQTWCSFDCGVALSLKKLAERKRKEYRTEKERQKTRGDWIREAQTAFNKWVRTRDMALGGGCISCGRVHQGQNHAGHYRPTSTAPALRFHPDNVHLQCSPCNTHLHGNLVNYRINLIKRIGVEKVEWLEGPHEPVKYTIEQLKEIKAECTKKARELAKIQHLT